MSLGLLIAVSLALGAAAWLAFLWSVRSGQYDDPEGPKYRMLEDDDERRDAGAPLAAPEEGSPRGARTADEEALPRREGGG
jgi:cbb3-type cytochrome oxidase maturation protein